MFVITGATGNTGSVAARTLLDAGHKVRVLVRDPSKVADLAARGAEVVRGDLQDPASLGAGLAGARGVYLLSPPDMKAADFVAERSRLLEAQAAALRAAGVPHVVFLSSIGAQHPSGTGPILTTHAGEKALVANGLPATFVRAGFFMQNWGGPLRVARQDGVLPSFVPAGLSMASVSAGDIGAVVARALLEGPRGTRIIELGGPVDYTPAEVAAAVSELLGRPIPLVEAPLDGVVPTYTAYGISPSVAGLYREMYQGFRDGLVTWQGSGTEVVRAPTGIKAALEPLLRA